MVLISIEHRAAFAKQDVAIERRAPLLAHG